MLVSTHTFKRPWDIVDSELDTREQPQRPIKLPRRGGFNTPYDRAVPTTPTSAVTAPSSITSRPKSQFITSFYPSTQPAAPRSLDFLKCDIANREVVLQRLSDYTWLTAITPLRLYVKLLVVWRVLLPGVATALLRLLAKFLSAKFNWIFGISFIRRLLRPYSETPKWSSVAMALLCETDYMCLVIVKYGGGRCEYSGPANWR